MSSLVIDVRTARPADAAQLADVYAVAWREAYSGIIPALTLERMIVRRSAAWWRDVLGRRSILVLDVGGAVAGYSSYAAMHARARPGTAEVQELYLRPEYQGIGLGVRLFAAVLRHVRARGYARVLVRALADNDRANGFYVRHGGKLVARTEESLGGKTLPCIWYEFRTKD
jgi:ribosomal protein S18 acetylase RimI-like enzyme